MYESRLLAERRLADNRRQRVKSGQDIRKVIATSTAPPPPKVVEQATGVNVPPATAARRLQVLEKVVGEPAASAMHRLLQHSHSQLKLPQASHSQHQATAGSCASGPASAPADASSFTPSFTPKSKAELRQRHDDLIEALRPRLTFAIETSVIERLC